MPSFVVRVWLPDRPGALGAVASRIGAVRGDLTGIDILERGAGRAIDELVVSLPSADLVGLLITEICHVDGVDVEDVRAVDAPLPDPRVGALETAAILVEQTDVAALLAAIAEHAVANFEASWCAVIDVAAPAPLAIAGVGEPPATAWLRAFVAGSLTSDSVAAGESGPDDIAWSTLGSSGAAILIGREGRPFRSRERRQLAALARIVDARWSELAARSLSG